MWKRFTMFYWIEGVEQGTAPLYALDMESAHIIGKAMLECYTDVRPFEILNIREEK